MKDLLSKKKNDLIKIILHFSILLSLINLSINGDIITLNDLKPEIKDFSLKIEDYFEFHLELKNESLESLKNSYIHFSTISSDKIGQQLFYSSLGPSLSNAERYSFKYLTNAHLFSNVPNKNKFYLRIKCSKYPCSFKLNSQIEKDYANLNFYDFDSYSYFVSDQIINTMRFKIPSSLDVIYDNMKHLVTICVSNPNDPEYTKLYLINESNSKEVKMDSYKTQTIILYTFILEDNINLNDINDNFILEIESMKDQFISISIKTSIYYEDDYTLRSDIIPNSNPKFSYISKENLVKIPLKEECFKINEEYINNYNKNDLLYASIEYYSSPTNVVLKYDDKNVEPEEKVKLGQTSTNLILKRISNNYPEICFNLQETEEISFMIEISYLSENNENIDIFNPLLTGLFHKKTINNNGLSVFTHNSDVHFFERITFYLKKLKGNPEMYIFPCEQYPDCYKDINQLQKDNNVIKPNMGNDVYNSYTYYTNRNKDFSPYYPQQNLLYIYCPGKDQEYCQSQILIYSNLDEILLFPDDIFYSNLKKDESNLFRIHLPKGKDGIKNIQIFLYENYSNESTEFISEDMKNITVKKHISDNLKIIEYIPDRTNLIHNKDFDILFNVKANNDLFYDVEYNLINKKDNADSDIYDFFMGKIGKVNEASSLEIYYPLPKNKDKNDLLFNYYFKSKLCINDNKTSLFDEIEINLSLISINSFIQKIKKQNNDDNILSISKNLFDTSTRSNIINIKRDDLENLWKQNNKGDEELVLFMRLNNVANNNNYNNYSNLYGQFFLTYKNNMDYIIPTNHYFSDQLLIENNRYNLYHLQLEGDEKTEFLVEFSSNYALENKDLYVLFLDYDTIKNINPKDLHSDSNNIEYINNKKYNLGGINYFEFKLKNNKKDLVLCALYKGQSNTKENELKTINYVFRYNTFKTETNENNNRVKYSFNNELKYKNNNNKTTITIERVKRTLKKEEYLSGEIYIRKIIKDNKKEKEDINTIAVIESKYELVNGDVTYKNETIEIEIPQINEKDYYSILISYPDDEQKFIYKINKDKKNYRTLILYIIIGSSILVILIIIIVVIICVTKKRGEDLKEDVEHTSFRQSGGIDKLVDNDESNE